MGEFCQVHNAAEGNKLSSHRCGLLSRPKWGRTYKRPTGVSRNAEKMLYFTLPCYYKN